MKRNALWLQPTGPGGSLEIVYLYNGRVQSYIPLPRTITNDNGEIARAALAFVQTYNKLQPDE